MAQSLKKILCHDRGKQDHLLVFGFMRNSFERYNIEEESKEDVPDDIMIEVLKYYFEFDKWDVNGYNKNTMEFDIENNSIKMVGGQSGSAYLLNICEAGNVYRWKFNIISKSGNGYTPEFGVWKVNEDNKPPVDQRWSYKSDTGAAMMSDSYVNGVEDYFDIDGWEEGDIVEMELKMSHDKRWGIKYFVNGKDVMSVHEYLYLWHDRPCKYRAGIGLSYGDCVQLL